MRVFKFGGASVKDADSVRNLAEILRKENEVCLVVISAMGKTTNLMERLTEAYFTHSTGQVFDLFNQMKVTHLRVFNTLLKDKSGEFVDELDSLFAELEKKLSKSSSLNYDYEYDQIVPFGELLSTRIVQSYLLTVGIDCDWRDIREVIQTDDLYRSANVDWDASQKLYDEKFGNLDMHIVTQGFIARERNGNTTTLGREGSDYTASVLAFMADANEVTIWKDVPGVMNADPKEFPACEKLDLISYQEAIELAFYGAKVIHPKTIQPLKQKGIVLKVKSFLSPQNEGSLIKHVDDDLPVIPVYILKQNQYLISISHKDLSFIMERQISEIYALFDMHKVRVNMSQNSAISYSVSVSCDKRRLRDLIADLKKHYNVLYNENVQLITIRHYTENCIKDVLKGKEVLLEQRSRKTARYVVR